MNAEMIFGLHFHQPVGQSERWLRDAFTRCYAPMLAELERWPEVATVVHVSGPLLEWLEESEPKWLDRLGALVARGQVELWGSGLYEPILASIPRADRRDQIRLMADRLRARFGVTPRGLWLTERVWEPGLAAELAEAGVEYTAVDDGHFRLAGWDPETLGGYYLTEDEGQPLALFPIVSPLRALMPFGAPESVLELVRARAAHGAVAFFDDVEKFGLWPMTDKTCWEERWVERLFALLSNPANGVRTVLPGALRDRTRPTARLYLPTASYPEMMEWSLPAETRVRLARLKDTMRFRGDPWRHREMMPFVGVGFFRNFLVRHPETNFLHKRMLRLSRLLRARGFATDSEPFRALFRCQCNCAYWHGLQDGNYQPELRAALWRELIAGERAVAPPTVAPSIEEADLEVDGAPLLRIDHPRWTAHVKPAMGGALVGLDLREPARALLDVVARHHEAYHGWLLPHRERARAADLPPNVRVLPEGVEVVHDWHRRASLVDHFYAARPTAADLAAQRLHDEGDFAIEPFDVEHAVEAGAARVRLWRDGALWRGTHRHPLRVVRTLRAGGDGARDVALSVEWEVENRGDDPIDRWLVTDWNLALLPGRNEVALAVGGRALREPALVDEERFGEVALVEPPLARRVRLVDPTGAAGLAVYPITTVSYIEPHHQGLCLALVRRLVLGPGERAAFTVELTIERA